MCLWCVGWWWWVGGISLGAFICSRGAGCCSSSRLMMMSERTDARKNLPFALAGARQGWRAPAHTQHVSSQCFGVKGLGTTQRQQGNVGVSTSASQASLPVVRSFAPSFRAVLTTSTFLPPHSTSQAQLMVGACERVDGGRGTFLVPHFCPAFATCPLNHQLTTLTPINTPPLAFGGEGRYGFRGVVEPRDAFAFFELPKVKEVSCLFMGPSPPT